MGEEESEDYRQIESNKIAPAPALLSRLGKRTQRELSGPAAGRAGPSETRRAWPRFQRPRGSAAVHTHSSPERPTGAGS